MKKILFATNFSDSCENAFKYILDMVKDKDITIDLVHVFQIAPTTLSVIPADTINSLIENRKELSLEKLSDLAKRIPEQNRGELIANYGVYPSSEIAENVESRNSDLVVMGLREKYSLLDRMIGTTTAFTIKESKVPVLAIPDGSAYTDIKDILFPTAIEFTNELENEEMEAIKWLNRFIKTLDGCKVHIIHIVQDHNQIDIQYKNLPLPQFDFTVAFADTIEDGLFKNLEKTKSNLIAFYKPHRNFWERLFHSSVSRKLLYQSRTPLLIF